MADDQQLSPEEYKQLQEIAAQLPTGHPAQAKVAALLASQPTQFEKQQTVTANAEGPVSRFARGALRTTALPESVSDIPRWASWLTGQQPGQEPWWQPQVNAYNNPTQENLVGAVPFVGPPSVAASRDVRSKNYAGALGDIASLPLSVRGGMEVSPGVSALKTSLAENLRAPDNTLTPSARLVGAGTGAAAGAVLTPTHPYLGASVGGSLGGGLADFLVPERAAAFKSSYPGYYSDFSDVAPGAFEPRSASPVPKPLFSKLPNRIPSAVRGDPFAPPTVSAEPIESPGAPLPSASDFYANEGALRMQLLKQAAERGDVNPMNPFAPQPKTSQPSPIVTPGGGARPRVGSEGRAATWTNERVQQLASEGNREAIQQATLRGMELPPNARYVMGDPRYSDVTYNPRDVTTFTPEGTPIRQSTKGIQLPPKSGATPSSTGINVGDLKFNKPINAQSGQPIELDAYRATQDPSFKFNSERGTFFSPEATPEFGNHVYKAKISFKNPLVVSDGVEAARLFKNPELEKQYSNALSGWDEQNDQPLPDASEAFEKADKSLAAIAKKAGHDGIIFKEHDGLNPVQYMALDENSVKNPQHVGEFDWKSGKVKPSKSAAAQPYTITNEMGIRWANTPGLPKISIPNGMAEADIPSYVAEKQALQKKGVSELFQ